MKRTLPRLIVALYLTRQPMDEYDLAVSIYSREDYEARQNIRRVLQRMEDYGIVRQIGYRWRLTREGRRFVK